MNLDLATRGSVGVVLAGGPGSRLGPLTEIINKHLLPVGKYSMICHPIHDLIDLGIKHIFIVTGHEHTGGFVELLGNGNRFGAKFTYLIQEVPDGLGGALKLVVDHLTRFNSGQGSSYASKLIVMLGDNIFSHDIDKGIVSYMKCAMRKKSTLDIFIKTVPDNKRFGVPELNSYNEIIKVEEKPKNPFGKYAVTGLYMFDMSIMGWINGFMNGACYKKSDRGEYEITDLINEIAFMASEHPKFNWRAQAHKIGNCFWTDAGMHESYQKANQYMKDWGGFQWVK